MEARQNLREKDSEKGR